ncbi:MAG: hypothetical protein IPL46_15595 [Saprospiraceae bacterium]|nr:hypothetical protein [Saprospiraceae bacterium]
MAKIKFPRFRRHTFTKNFTSFVSFIRYYQLEADRNQADPDVIKFIVNPGLLQYATSSLALIGKEDLPKGGDLQLLVDCQSPMIIWRNCKRILPLSSSFDPGCLFAIDFGFARESLFLIFICRHWWPSADKPASGFGKSIHSLFVYRF